MKQINNTALSILLLIGCMWLCLSVSEHHVQESFPLKTTAGTKEQLNQNSASKAIAWSEQTRLLVHAAEPFLQALAGADHLFLLHSQPFKFKKISSVIRSFSSLAVQFRIQPNAP